MCERTVIQVQFGGFSGDTYLSPTETDIYDQILQTTVLH